MSGGGRLALIGAAIGLAVAGRALLRPPAADLRGQVALVTGGSRGLGLLTAREMARAGCRVVICARDAAELERGADMLRREGATVLAEPCDVTDRAAVGRLVERATDHFGRIDVLVANAGAIQVGPLATMTAADFEAALAVIFWGTVHPVLAVLPQMRARRRGRIAVVTSIGGKIPVPHLLPYSTAKFAATAFAEGLRAELAPAGVTVTTIVPGLMRTGSPVNATFKGRPEAEFAWFAVADSLPFLSMDAERAARQIVEATRRGEAERILTLPAALGARIFGLAPGLTADLLGAVNRVLPDAGDAPTRSARGEEARRRLASPTVDRLIAPTLSAAERFNQYPDPRPVGDGEAPAGRAGDPPAEAPLHQHGDSPPVVQ